MVRPPDNSTILSAEATTITLSLDYYRHMEPVRHDVVYPDSMSCLQAIEGEYTLNHRIWYIMGLLWLLSDKGTRVRFCWIPSHCGIGGNERVDWLAKETFDHETDTLASVQNADWSHQSIPISNSWFKWSGTCLYMADIFISWNQH